MQAYVALRRHIIQYVSISFQLYWSYPHENILCGFNIFNHNYYEIDMGDRNSITRYTLAKIAAIGISESDILLGDINTSILFSGITDAIHNFTC